MLVYWLYRLGGILVPLIPRRVGYALMGVVAGLLFRLNSGRRRVLTSNLRHVLGAAADPARVTAVARRAFHNLLKNYFDLFWLPAQPGHKVARLIRTRGYENAEAAMALGKGMIIVAAHMGNQEIMTRARLVTDFRITLVVEHLKPERLFNYLMQVRQSDGLRLIAQDGALRELLRALKRGEAIALAFDRDATESGRVVPFFGLPARLPDGYALLGLRFGAPIVPVFVLREADETFTIVVEKPIILQGNASNDDDVYRAMTDVTRIFEHYLATYPDQWVYFHYVWEDDKQRERAQREKSD